MTTTNYRNGRGNFRDCFLRIQFFDNKINIFVVEHFADGGGDCQEKRTFCANVDKWEQPLMLHYNKSILHHIGR